MDTNLKNQNDNSKMALNKNRNFFTGSIIMVLMIFIFAAVSVASYLPIRSVYFPIEDNVKNYIENTGTNGIAYNIARLTKHLQNSVNRTDRWIDDRYINIESVKYRIHPLDETGNSEQISENETDRDREETGTRGESGTTDTKDIKIQRRSITNMPHISDAELRAEIDDSLLYIKITFDETGHPAVEAVLGDTLRDRGTRFDKDLIIEYLGIERMASDRDNDLPIDRSDSEQTEQYTNLEATYIIQQDFESYNDILTLDMKENYVFPGYSALILAIGATSILLLIAAAFAIPYSLQNQVAICRGFNKMPLELKLGAWILLIALCGVNVAAFDSLLGYGYNYVNPVIKMVYDADPCFYIIGILITFMLYFLIYLGTVYIKHIYHTGFKEGFVRNSILGRIALNSAGNIKDILKSVMAIDLKEDNQRRLIGIAVMNFLVIVISGSGGAFGFILAAIYSIIVFKYVLKLVENASELNLASEQVSAGNFDIKVNEDMGILTPMAKNLNNIKQGFSLAVDKEIKGERMKTELISNVSHDLKTPLTSIITYVDLLKNEDIESDTQEEYIDIIDRKSKRLNILIEDLFEASKATSGDIELNLENIDVIALLRQTLGELGERINESSLQFRINTPENRVMCNLDGKRTYRVFENIINNILKYSMENSRVYIDVIEEEQDIAFIFKNISAYEMNFDPTEILERFTRGDESRSTGGSGLGLSIAKSLVELQGGTLDIIIDGDLFKLTVVFTKAQAYDAS